MSNRRNTSPKRRKPWQPYLRLPAFLPVPLRARRDGWTSQRQARFIGLLAQTGCVRRAAQMLGLSRESAYRLRRHRHAASFRAAWETAASGRAQPRRKVTRAERLAHATDGALQPRLYRGRFTHAEQKFSNSDLLRLLGQLYGQRARALAAAAGGCGGGAHSAAPASTSLAG